MADFGTFDMVGQCSASHFEDFERTLREVEGKLITGRVGVGERCDAFCN